MKTNHPKLRHLYETFSLFLLLMFYHGQEALAQDADRGELDPAQEQDRRHQNTKKYFF